MITIKQIESPAVVTDGGVDTNLYAGQTYTCGVPEVNEWLTMTIDTRITSKTPSDTMEFRFVSINPRTFDWGDGSDLDYNSDLLSTHTYATGGIYTVKIKGSGQMDMFTSDNLKIIGVSNMGDFYHTVLSQTWWDGANIVWTATDTIRGSGNIGTAFYLNISLVTPPKFSYITVFSTAFAYTSLNDDLGYMDLRLCSVMTSFAQGVTTWSQANYSATLMGWLRWDSITHAPAIGWVLKSNVTFHGGNSTVAIGSEAALARTYLISTLGWIITDGGEI